MLSPKDLKDMFADSTPERVLLRAQKLAAKGRNDQALQVLKEAIDRFGEVADLRIEMASLSLSSGRPRDAAAALKALVRASASNVPRVEEYVGWARTQFSDIEPLYEALAEGHVARRNLSAAVDSLERIERKALESLIGTRLASLNRFLEKGGAVPKSAVPTLYFAALGWEAAGDWQRALDTYRKVLAAAPAEFATVDERLKGLVGRNFKLIPLRLQYAELLAEQGHDERARAENLQALEIDARSAPHVLRFFSRRLEAAPGDPELLWAMARVQVAAGSLPDALATCTILIDASSHLPEIEKLCDELASTGKESVDTQLLLCRVAAAQGKAQRAIAAAVAALSNEGGARAIEALERIVIAFPAEARPYQILADHHMKEGRVAKCLEIFQALRRANPSASSAIATRLQAVLMADPTNAQAQELLEEVCVETGDARGAVPFLRRRIRMGPPQAAAALARIRPMLASSPSEEGLKLAAAEACCASGDAPAAWGFLQDLLAPGREPDSALLHLVVLCAGSSVDMYRTISAHLGQRAGARAESAAPQPEFQFALGEAAGRVGQYREAVDRFRAVASAAPEGAAACTAAVLAMAGGVPADNADDRAALAESLLDAGDAGAAITALRGIGELPPAAASRLVERFSKALRADPKNLELSSGLAGVCLAAGQVPRALEIARVALAGREDAATAPLTLVYGEALARSGRLPEATRAYAAAARREPALGPDVIALLQTLVRIDAGQDTAHLTLGRLLINAGRVAEGVSALMSAWSVKSEHAPAILKDLTATSRRHPGEPSVEMARAQLLLSMGDPAGAAESLSSQIDREPQRIDAIVSLLEGVVGRHEACARAHLELGRAYLHKRWAARACASLMKAYGLDRGLAGAILEPLARLERDFPEEQEAHMARGALHEGEGRMLPAGESYLRAASLGGARGALALESLRRLCREEVRRGPESPAVGRLHLMRARAARLLDGTQEAVEAARAAVAAAVALAPEARAEIDKLVSRRAGGSSALLARAEASVSMQDHAAATRDIQEALRLDRSCAAPAAELARRISALHPASVEATRTLAEALALSGDRADAARVLDAFMAGSPGAADLDLILSRRALARQAGDSALARELLARAERLAPSRDRFLQGLHHEELRARRAAPDGADDVVAVLESGEFLRAAQMVESEPACPRKAWILRRCGRSAEAAACLREVLDQAGAADEFASIHDRVVAADLSGRAPVLMAAAPLQFENPSMDESLAPRAERAAGSAHGGAR